MIYAKYRLSDGVFLCSWPSKPDYDPATEGVQEYLEHLRPNLRSERYDAESKHHKRAATDEELAAYDRAKIDVSARVSVGQDLAYVALVRWIAQRFGITEDTAQEELIAIQKELRQRAADSLAASADSVESPVKGT